MEMATRRAHPASRPEALAASLVFVRDAARRLLALDGDPAELDLHRLQALPHPVPERRPLRVVAVGIVVSILVVAWLIGRLNRLYIRITGTNRLAPMRPTWLKSMRDTAPAREHRDRGRGGADGLGACSPALALTVWFFLLAGSPIPNQ